MNPADILIRLGAKEYELTRQSGTGDFSSGVFEPSETQVSVITGRDVPASGQVLMQLEEGDRAKEVLTFYTAVELFTASETLGIQADILTVRGKKFQVQAVKNWGNLFEATLLSMNTEEAA